MPLKNKGVVCINHPNSLMLRNDGFNAITKLEKEDTGGIQFLPESGIPAVVYFCEKCGYLEIYAAAKTPFWDAK
ncbi:hypothetical protein R4Z09_26115 [Niallia oryzisoli]|uniref:Uncharacterized protein n=1 Tax=Niallia oryzisoli TaxID=1737571 RepID=A0ABZ2CCB0_9BACI